MKNAELIFRVNGQRVGMARREQWMFERDLQHTMVCGIEGASTPLEQDITTYFDKLVRRIFHGATALDEEAVAAIKGYGSAPPTLGEAVAGAQSIQTVTGNVYDRIFKQQVNKSLHAGCALHSILLKHGASPRKIESGQILNTAAASGPDVVMNGTRTGWDLTTADQVFAHFRRDVIGRGYQRYYLLVYDAPNALPRGFVDAPEA